MNIKIIILAAGMGKRMESDLPKVLAKIKGKSMIRYLLESVGDSKIDTKPIVVVGYKKNLVIEELGSKYEYVAQEKQLGTGNAVSCAKKSCKDAEHVIILYGDHPFVSKETIKKLLEKHLNSGEKVTSCTELPGRFKWRLISCSTCSSSPRKAWRETTVS